MQGALADERISQNADNQHKAASAEANSMYSRVSQPTILGAGLRIAQAGMGGYYQGKGNSGFAARRVERTGTEWLISPATTPVARRRIASRTTRDSIAPLNRDTRTDAVQVRASLRDAFRADPQGEALRQFLGQTQRTAEAFYENDINERREQAEVDFGQGSTDAASGAEMDPALAQSVAYQRAYNSTTATSPSAEVRDRDRTGSRTPHQLRCHA